MPMPGQHLNDLRQVRQFSVSIYCKICRTASLRGSGAMGTITDISARITSSLS